MIFCSDTMTKSAAESRDRCREVEREEKQNKLCIYLSIVNCGVRVYIVTGKTTMHCL